MTLNPFFVCPCNPSAPTAQTHSPFFTPSEPLDPSSQHLGDLEAFHLPSDPRQGTSLRPARRKISGWQLVGLRRPPVPLLRRPQADFAALTAVRASLRAAFSSSLGFRLHSGSVSCGDKGVLHVLLN